MSRSISKSSRWSSPFQTILITAIGDCSSIHDGEWTGMITATSNLYQVTILIHETLRENKNDEIFCSSRSSNLLLIIYRCHRIVCMIIVRYKDGSWLGDWRGSKLLETNPAPNAKGSYKPNEGDTVDCRCIYLRRILFVIGIEIAMDWN